MKRNFLSLGAVLMLIAVILGAVGAHVLQEKISHDELSIFEKGVRYHVYHALGLILIGVIRQIKPVPIVKYAGFLFLLGIILFSGSLYLLAMKDIMRLNDFSWIIGPLTPIGGLCFIIGWGILSIAYWKN